jgi:hypothetical protein
VVETEYPPINNCEIKVHCTFNYRGERNKKNRTEDIMLQRQTHAKTIEFSKPESKICSYKDITTEAIQARKSVDENGTHAQC